jgi:quinol monooxygenase YgiN
MTSTTALVRHRVANYDSWKTVYDNFAPIQAEHGVRAHQVLRSQESPNDVVILHTFDDLKTAKTFFAMPELKQAMSKAGVEDGSMKISFYDEVEAGTLIAV